jgi:chromosome partitioning protein
VTGKVVCFLNYKGGVGKTVTAVNVACYLSLEHGKKVLIIDLDPQNSATFHLMPQDEEHRAYLGYGVAWKKWKESRGSLYDIFMSYAKKRKPPPIYDIIVTNVIEKGPTALKDNLHLLPSDIGLIDIDIYLDGLPMKGLDILSREIAKVRSDYDYVICDCPPNLYSLTKNGLFATDYYIIPVLPDYLSTLGIYELINRVELLEKAIGKRIDCRGIIFTRIDRRYSIHETRMHQIRHDDKLLKRDITPFENPIRNIASIQYAADYCLPLCVYAPSSPAASDFEAVAEEFIKRVG